MSTALALDIRAGMTQWLMALTSFYCNDIKALPADKLDANGGGVSRSPKAITAEVIWLINWGTAMLNGTEAPGSDTQDQTLAGFSDADSLCSAIQAATQNFAGAINGSSDETLGKVVTPPWGMEAPAHVIANIIINHIWYHDGQICYLQAIHGDDKMHWME